MSSNWPIPFSRFLDYMVANPRWIVLAFLTYVIVFVISLMYGGRKPGRNPFMNCTVKPPQPLETDQKKRDKVLKQGFAVHKLPERIDVIIIGSGIGALSVAALLSRAGKKVIVLEQHDQAGGSCHTFIEDGFEFDVGIHYIGGMNDGRPNRILVDYITNGQLCWDRLDNEFDVAMIGSHGKYERIAMEEGGRENYLKNLIKYFPDEEQAIRKYFDLTKNVSKGFRYVGMLKFLPKWLCQLMVKTGVIHLITDAFKWSSKSAQEVINELTDKKKLRLMLAYNCGDYGGSPGNSSFLIQAGLAEHYMDGGFYPRGGSSEIAFHAIGAIEQYGGHVFVRAPVSKILLNENGKVCGVSVNKGGGDIEVNAPIVISDAGYANTFLKLLPKDVAQKTGAYQYIERCYSKDQMYFSAFVGLSATKEELIEHGMKAQNYWIYNSFKDITKGIDDYLELSPDVAMEADIPGCFISFPSSKDSCWNEKYPGKAVVTLVTYTPWAWFSKWTDERVKHRGDDYEDLKNGIGKKLWERCVDVFPYLKDKAVYTSFGSAISNDYYLGSHQGATLGVEHSPLRFSPEVAVEFRPRTDIPGLYMTGQDVLASGFAGAMWGGVMCSSAVLGRNLVNDFTAYKKLARSKSVKKDQ